MPSVFSHAVAASSIGTCFYKPGIPKRIWLIGMVCAALPDIDVVGFQFGVDYGDSWGHRGFTHSFAFAALLAAIALVLCGLRGAPGVSRFNIWFFLFIATASHGFLDAFTDGGLGVAFFSPFDNQRYFFPWRPIHVSPIGLTRFFSARGLDVLQSELLWVWLPAGALALLTLLVRRRRVAASGGG